MNLLLSRMTEQDYSAISSRYNTAHKDLEFLEDFKAKKGVFYIIQRADDWVGLVQIRYGKRGFVYIYVEPVYRNQGIATRAYALCERQIRAHGAAMIGTSYNASNPVSKHFAEQKGFVRKFESTYMTYSGDPYPIQDMPIRAYEDEDYPHAHELYARAFHEMRVSVGDFPDSVVELPSHTQREFWRETCDQRYVYMEDNHVLALARVVGNEISSISVKPAYQGQGIGRDFMKYLCNTLLMGNYDTIRLWCVEGNKAKGLYEALGFKASFTAEFAEKELT